VPLPLLSRSLRAERLLSVRKERSYGSFEILSLGLPAEMREFWRVWDLLPVYHGMMTM
jgi:hypothetical protein